MPLAAIPQRTTSPTRRRPRLVTLVAVTTLAVAVGAAPVAAKDAKQKPVVKMSVGELTLYKVGAEPPALPDDVRDQVMATLKRYVDAATVKPLRKGAADLDALAAAVTPTVAARLAGPDRAVLVDEGLPKSTARVKVTATPIALTALADASGQIVVVTALFDSTAKTRTTKGALTVQRTGELELTPVDGVWKISGYTLTVDRAGKGIAPPATDAPATEGAPGEAPPPAAAGVPGR